MAQAARNRHAAVEGTVDGQDIMAEEDSELVVAAAQDYSLIAATD